MQSVSQLDENHPHVACHRQQHFAEIFRLCVFFCFKLDAVELTQSVNQISYRFAKFAGDIFFTDVGVFHHIM